MLVLGTRQHLLWVEKMSDCIWSRTKTSPYACAGEAAAWGRTQCWWTAVLVGRIRVASGEELLGARGVSLHGGSARVPPSGAHLAVDLVVPGTPQSNTAQHSMVQTAQRPG